MAEAGQAGADAGPSSRGNSLSCQQRLEEAEIALQAAHEVNAHLNGEVERLTLALDSAAAERQAYEARQKSLSKLLAAARAQLADAGLLPPAAPPAAPAPAAAEGAAAQEEEEGAAGRDEAPGASGSSPPDPAGGSGQPEGGATAAAAVAAPEQPWRAGASAREWERLRHAGEEAGWLIDPEEVVLGEVLGEGAFGQTFGGTWRGGLVAVKAVRLAGAEDAAMFLREVEALSLVRHPNVMAMFGACMRPPDACWLVCEFLPGGTLATWLHGPRTARVPPRRPLSARLAAALDVARGMQALEQHSPPILHRDLKPSNVFLDASGTAKVADMGLARVLTEPALLSLTGETGTYVYMSPECIRHEPYATRSDVWSWAVLALECLTQQRPYSGLYATPVQVAIQVGDGTLRPAVPPDTHPLLADLLTASFDPDPLNRPSFGLIVSAMTRVVAEVRAAAAAEEGQLDSAWGRWFRPKQPPQQQQQQAAAAAAAGAQPAAL